MKIRESLRKIRLRLFEGEGERSVDNVDAMTTMHHTGNDPNGDYAAGSAPTNWVPSQQDERPRH